MSFSVISGRDFELGMLGANRSHKRAYVDGPNRAKKDRYLDVLSDFISNEVKSYSFQIGLD